MAANAYPMHVWRNFMEPSESTAPDVEEMILTLVDLVGMDADHSATMTRSEFCSI